MNWFGYGCGGSELKNLERKAEKIRRYGNDLYIEFAKLTSGYDEHGPDRNIIFDYLDFWRSHFGGYITEYVKKKGAIFLNKKFTKALKLLYTKNRNFQMFWVDEDEYNAHAVHDFMFSGYKERFIYPNNIRTYEARIVENKFKKKPYTDFVNNLNYLHSKKGETEYIKLIRDLSSLKTLSKIKLIFIKEI
jgi:hypothetical protein